MNKILSRYVVLEVTVSQMEYLTYNIDKNGSNEWQQDGIHSTVRDWNRVLNHCNLNRQG
jgi:hypothetical protein